MNITLEPADLGSIAFDCLRNDFHRPIVDGKCNRELIEDKIVDGIYTGQLGPMTASDVKFVCDIIDDLIKRYGK